MQNREANMLTIALSKGRILKQTLPLLEQAGLQLLDDPFTSRKLIFKSNVEHVQFLVLRATDVPTYVQFGSADLGIVGKDGVMEHGGIGLCELLDLQIAKCQLMTARINEEGNGVERAEVKTKAAKTVATKYVNIAKKYYQEQGIQAKLIKLYGAMELAPLIGLADEIVDLVETGNTLKANNLVAKEHIADISCRLIANAAAMKVKYDVISQVLSAMKKAVEQSK